MNEITLSAFLLGLLGTGHCVAMCGGIAAALGLHRSNVWFGNLLYQLGRICTYAFIGLIFGFVGVWIPSEFTLILRLIAAVLLIVVAFYIAGWSSLILAFESIGKPVWKIIAPFSKKFSQPKRVSDFVIAGMIWGWLPCGLVYSALGLAILQGSPQKASITMLAFGLGTIPGMVTLSFAGFQFKKLSNHQWVRFTGSFILIAMAIWMIANILQNQTHG